MTRYTGPRIKIIRRLGFLPGLTRKNIKNRSKTPGQHGTPILKKTKRSYLSTNYKERLVEKQKLRFNYGVTEKQLISYYKKAKSRKDATGPLILELLEARLDCILYRLGFAPTIPAARQIVNHNHICVNKKPVDIPSFHCKANDIITIKEHVKSKNLVLGYFETQQRKRKLVERRMKRVNLAKSRFNTLLPHHLEINIPSPSNVSAKILSPIHRKDVSLQINELKVVEYYSR